jgi:multicomponent Na+:H+ antiporter subunit F
MFEVASCGLLLSLALVLVRAFIGPTVFDRAQAANTVGTLAVLLLAVLGFLSGRPDFLDLAIVYGLLNLVSTIAVLNYFQYAASGEEADRSRSAG